MGANILHWLRFQPAVCFMGGRTLQGRPIMAYLEFPEKLVLIERSLSHGVQLCRHVSRPLH